MKVSSRHFRITAGPIVKACIEMRHSAGETHKQFLEIIGKVGAKQYYSGDQSNELVAIEFEEAPDPKYYKRRGDGWYPKLNTKVGRELNQAILSVCPKGSNHVLKAAGLPSSPTIFHGSSAHYPVTFFIPSAPPVVFIKVPWYDEDPVVLEHYVKDRAAGIQYDANCDSLLWKPSAEMVEVKSWEVDKEIDEWNESLSQKETR